MQVITNPATKLAIAVVDPNENNTPKNTETLAQPFVKGKMLKITDSEI